jgi:hypothetical protein
MEACLQGWPWAGIQELGFPLFLDLVRLAPCPSAMWKDVVCAEHLLSPH